jgi:hypothetical protein
MNAKEISQRIKTERQLIAISGVNSERFSMLLPIFEQYLNIEQEEKYKDKTRKRGSGKKGDIESPSEKLLFLLHYLKCYSTFDHLGFSFGISGASASQYIYQLFPILAKTLHHFALLPHTVFNTPEEMKQAFQGFDTLLVDATERSIQRPQDNEIQKDSFSGKKNNIPISTPLFRP